ncbi:alpha-2-macroglobulin-P-like [Danio aesculapii]|uniref:alpha-2-macroglobulin-P-like n=1 Tax=Danio aesculapii TaxID=1142201 RepID=UPI0024C0894D|nr:alpha-2-macroglobulin-P-like [Danio aesculapii]
MACTLVIMALNVSCCWKGLLLIFFLSICAHGEAAETSFMVTFPAVIESGSEAKLCASLLKPNESLVMNIYLVDGSQSTLLLQEKAEQEFHRCFNFKAPLAEAESVQKIKVELQGESFKMTEERKVMFKSYDPLTFIQTDKPIYMPGQTVNFRVVTMDSNFAPVDQQYSIIVLEDSRENRIGQWTNVSSTRWILQRSYELNPECREGSYQLKAFIGEIMISHYFQVKKYVLPKFEVTVKRPNKVSAVEEELLIEVCAKYTYGQPVPGKSWVKVCRNSLPYIVVFPLCLEETIEITKTGCAIHNFGLSMLLNSTFKERLKNSFHVEAVVTEEGTEITMAKSESVPLTYEIGKVTLIDLPKTYEHGSVIEGKIKLSDFKDAPIPNKEVYLLEGENWSSKLLLNLTTDSDGLASFSLNTSSFSKEDISLIANVYPDTRYQGYMTPYFSTDKKNVQLFQIAAPYSPTLSELIIENIEQPLKCDTEITVTVKYYFVGETVEDFNTDIVYMVLSRGAIVHHGYEKVEVKSSSNGVASGTMSFKLSVGADVAPEMQILVYCVLPSENIIAASKRLDTEKCFGNKVSLQFSPAKAVPGEKNTLQLSAQPGSLCGLSAVDQSVLILESGKRLDADKIFNLLPVQSVSYYPYSVEDEQACLYVRPRRSVLTDNTYESLKSVGLKMATNLAVRVPECLSYRGLTYHKNIVLYRQYAPVPVMFAQGMAGIDGPDGHSPSVTIRTVFPETWIWELAEVGDSGSAEIPVTVPDTITSWETEAFCLSSTGLGLAPPAQLTVFQPFFLELSLPYSIIRGEIFELKATVFNYLSKCIMVKVSPAPSSDYTLKASSDDQYSSCLCANGRKTFKWTLTPSVLGVVNITVSAEAEASQTVCDNEIVSVPERGRIDIVTRSLLVQAEGSEKTETKSWLLCPKGDSLSEEVDLTIPKDVIEGSAKSSVSVIGDILGRALQNLHGLLRMPYGCGEQNMAVLSPNIYILQYLENTKQLTSAIREKASSFLKSGYQRQLNYKHSDGAYSTFGYGDGNTWLTAFVLRSFGKAQKYTFIDPQIIQSAKDWLLSRRDSDGCFIQQGRLFNNRMKGGVNDNVTMTAYITASLLELETPVTDPVITKGFSCLRSVIEDVKNTYTTALLAYTFSLARDTNTRQQLFNKLEDLAISDGPLVHWSQSASADDSNSLDVEISSYVLLAVLTADSLTPADLGFANRIVSWLVKQQNAYGGFSSTQDTVVALQALSLYATKVFSPDGSSTVTVQSAGDSHRFDVNQDNKLLYQEKQLANVPGKYSIEVKGSACVSVQMAQFYNIPTPTEAKTLSIDAIIKGDCEALGQNFIFDFTVKYGGPEEKTNMAIVDIKLLSGFTADTSALGTSGTYVSLVERVDSKDDHVIVYLKEIPKNVAMNYQIQMKQVLPVKNLKPAVVKVYDYYQTSDQSEIEYSFHCEALKNIN